MKTFLTIVAVLMLTACNGTTKTRTIESIDGTAFDVIEVDSCEYLVTTRGYQGYMAHKGNCKYCEQRRKKWQ
jgi:outer membrane biogenesis lipoprotein LolB